MPTWRLRRCVGPAAGSLIARRASGSSRSFARKEFCREHFSDIHAAGEAAIGLEDLIGFLEICAAEAAQAVLGGALGENQLLLPGELLTLLLVLQLRIAGEHD